MTLYGVLFYVLSAVVVASTGLAVTRRVLMHTLVYLIISFIATALIFYLLGAPLLAVFQVIIYAGAIMVLFLFIIMLMHSAEDESWEFSLKGCFLQLCLAALTLAAGLLLLLRDPQTGAVLELAIATPRELGRFVFEKYWLAVEVISLLLFAALAGAYFLGRSRQRLRIPQGGEK